MVEDILDQVQQLTPSERRRLYRLLQINGLMEREELLSDRNPLAISTAVSPRILANRANRVRARKTASAQPEDGAVQKAAPDPEPEAYPRAGYRSAVSGRVVAGAPGDEEGDAHRLDMQPLPGQAPEEPIRIVFDGGSKGNPGQGYGSYALEWPGFPRQVVRLTFGDEVTNNEAEYDTLIAALEALVKRMAENDVAPETAKIEAWGDSQLVINQVNGEWKTNKAELEVRRDRAQELLARFGSAHLRYHERQKSVDILGH